MTALLFVWCLMWKMSFKSYELLSQFVYDYVLDKSSAADQSNSFSLSSKWLFWSRERTNTDYNGNLAKSVVCPIMAHAHSGPMYLAFLFFRGLLATGLKRADSQTQPWQWGNYKVYKYELQHHMDLVTLEVNLSSIAAQISPIRQSWMQVFL